MFASTRNETMLGAALATLGLIYTVTVHNLRSTDRNPLVGLVMTALRSLVMVGAFMVMFYLLGVRRSPVRGDFLIYVMTGIFLYQTHVSASSAVASAGSGASAIMKHGPMNTAVVITAAGLASLYRTAFAAFAILGVYWLIKPFHLEHPIGVLAMLIMAWFSGAAVGLVFLAIRPWSPKVTQVGSQVYARVQMIASGKMFVANMLPGFMLNYFDWNPLFHVIDQARGYAFINYTPHYSSPMYAVYFTLIVVMIGLMGEFVTRKSESASWSAGR